jgi:acylphosphatase
MERRHLLVAGHVQGVFFRSSTQDVAQGAGCTGWVRNLRDGRVEVEVQGDPQAVERVVDHCRTGPPQAKVTNMVTGRRDPVEGEHAFEVR